MGWGLNSPSWAQEDVNLALGKEVFASAATWGGQIPEHLTDGILNNQSHPLASSGTIGFYYEVDLGQEYSLDRVILINRTGCCPDRLSNYRVSIFEDNNGQTGAVNWSADIRTDGSNSGDGGRDTLRANLDPDGTFKGRFIRVINRSNAAYNPQLAELEAYAAPHPVIDRFTTDTGNITKSGDPNLPTEATLSWKVRNFDTITITPGIGSIDEDEGSIVVSPEVQTTYTLTATNESGTNEATVTVGVDAPTFHPQISEFEAAGGSLHDAEGDRNDWIELYNPNPFSLNIDGYRLTDNSDLTGQWVIPNVSIPAEGFLVIFASGKDLSDPAGELHTHFQLEKSGEYLGLIDVDGTTIIDQYPVDHPQELVYPQQKDSVSYGRDANGDIGYLQPSTPGSENGIRSLGFVKDTSFMPDRGFYTEAFDLTISSLTDGSVIRYTLDETEPTLTSGFTYDGPIQISETTVVRARAYLDGYIPTNIDTQTYIFLDDVIDSPVMDTAITQNPQYSPQILDGLSDLPTISLVTETAVRNTTEVTGSIEWIDPNTGADHQDGAGIRYFGGAFTNFAKKNFRLYFRGIHGARKFKFPLFDGHENGVPAVDTFDQLELRGGSHDMVARGFYMSNRLTDDTMLDMGNLNPHGRFVHLYINGTYWGQYHLRERWNASMQAEYLGGKKDDYEAINGNWNVGGWADPGSVYDGDGSAWQNIKNLRANYVAVSPYLDVAHYVDYMLMWMFGNSEDEYRCAGPVAPGSGFKFYLNDADGFTRSAGNRTGRGAPGRQAGDGPGSIFSMLFAQGHSEYLTLLGDRIHRHFFNGGALTTESMRARLLLRCDQVERAFIAEAARWGYRTPASWASARDSYVNGVLASRSETVLNQYKAAGFYPSLEAPQFNQTGSELVHNSQIHMTTAEGTIYYTFDGSDPRLVGGGISDTAIALDSLSNQQTLIGSTNEVFVHVPNDGQLGLDWIEVNFTPNGWLRSPAGSGVGYDEQTTYDDHIDLDIESEMNNVHPSVYLRYEFDLDDPGSVVELQLRFRFDDGYVAYLNGEEIAAENEPDALSWSSSARNSHSDGQAVNLVLATFTHPNPRTLLRTGKNVLAIHGLNTSSGSSDFLMEPRLTALLAGEEGDGFFITRSTPLKARARSGGDWSALNEVTYTVNSGDLQITEIMYHPLAPAAGSAFTKGDFEFLELENTGDHPLNLSQMKIEGGISFEFPKQDDDPDMDLNPGEVVLVVKDLEAFQDRYPDPDLYVAGEYQGSLSNGGEELILKNRRGVTICNFTYDDEWDPTTDGEGSSLVLIDLLTECSDRSDPDSWKSSLHLHGSPGISESDGTTEGGFQKPGDANQDGFIDLGDSITLLLKVLGRDTSLPCSDGNLAEGGNLALLNLNGDQTVDISDVVYQLTFLYLDGAAPEQGVFCRRIPNCPDVCN